MLSIEEQSLPPQQRLAAGLTLGVSLPQLGLFHLPGAEFSLHRSGNPEPPFRFALQPVIHDEEISCGGSSVAQPVGNRLHLLKQRVPRRPGAVISVALEVPA